MSEALRIDGARLKRDFVALSEIGSTGDGGVHRPTFSAAHLAARQWFRERAAAEGFAVREDRAGNLSARHDCVRPDARTLVLGSHLDSVPNGGRFDGALGVMVALEVLRTVRDAGLALPVHLEAMDFTDEEGTLIGLTGSRALCGLLDAADLATPRCGLSHWRESLARAGLTGAGFLQAKRDPATLAGWLELHIEQAPRLINSNTDIGIVTALVGIRSLNLRFDGRADHAGTTAMDARADAGLGAAAFMQAARTLVVEQFPDCTFNVGDVRLAPGAFNIVPAQADLKVEFRAGTERTLDAMQAAIVAVAGQIARDHGLAASHSVGGCVVPAQCDPAVQAAFEQASEMLGLRHTRLTSGAGHDTQNMATITPSGMIFIPSTGGSHNPNEFAEWDAVQNGANVMLHAALRLAEGAA